MSLVGGMNGTDSWLRSDDENLILKQAMEKATGPLATGADKTAYAELMNKMGGQTMDLVKGIGGLANTGFGIASFFENKKNNQVVRDGMIQNQQFAKEARQDRTNFLSGTKSAFA